MIKLEKSEKTHLQSQG